MKRISHEIEKFVTEDAKYYAEKQQALDSYIRSKHNISETDWNSSHFFKQAHYIALKNEVNEFINECRDIWKYWKKKPVDKEKLIDEFVDIIHFSFLIHNKTDDTSLDNILLTSTRLIDDVIEQGVTKEQIGVDLLSRLESSEHYQDILAHSLVVVIGLYDFNANDIKQAYDRKNKENYERQNKGW